MNIRRTSLALVLALSSSGLVLAAQDDHRDNQQEHQQDQDRARDNRDESRFNGNANFQRGWKDGQHHKHKNKKWKNDSDREAYEAGYGHGDRGEQRQNPDQRGDHDNR
jgi:hypothetical protein